MTNQARQLFHRVRSLFFRGEQDRDFDAQMSHHLELAIEENLQRGLSPDEARRQALVRFGGPQQAKEHHREARGLPLLETLLQDFRFALRMLRRSPGFALLAIFCLTLGIGANAAVFSWMEGLLFRPYPLVANQERLVALTGTARAQGQTDRTALSWPDFLDLQRNCKLFDTFFVSKITGTTLSIGDRAQVVTGSIVSANYFNALGIHPILGRTFESNEDVGRSAHPVTVISYQLWKERFGGDPQIIGKTQRMDGVIHTIIGVAPEGFYGTFVGWAMKFWVPASMEDTFEAGGFKLEDRGERWIEAYGRLKPGVTLEQAQQEVSALAKRLEMDFPETNRARRDRRTAHRALVRPFAGVAFAGEERKRYALARRNGLARDGTERRRLSCCDAAVHAGSGDSNQQNRFSGHTAIRNGRCGPRPQKSIGSLRTGRGTAVPRLYF